MVEADGLRVQRAQAPHSLDRKAGGARQLLGSWHAAESILEQRGGPAKPAQVGGAVERYADRTTMAGDGSLDRLPDPPHCIRDELDPAIRIKLPRGGHQAEVPLANEIHERDAAVL